LELLLMPEKTMSGSAVEHAGERQVHAVGGRAGDAPGVLVAAAGPDRLVEGEELEAPERSRSGSDDGDPVAGGAQALGQVAGCPGRPRRRRC
jgi:hypothetical protein